MSCLCWRWMALPLTAVSFWSAQLTLRKVRLFTEQRNENMDCSALNRRVCLPLAALLYKPSIRQVHASPFYPSGFHGTTWGSWNAYHFPRCATLNSEDIKYLIKQDFNPILPAISPDKRRFSVWRAWLAESMVYVVLPAIISSLCQSLLPSLSPCSGSGTWSPYSQALCQQDGGRPTYTHEGNV